MIIKKIVLLLVFLPVCFKLSAQLCQGSLGDPIINITFGAGANPGPMLTTTTNNLQYISGDCPNDGSYTVRSSTNQCFFNTWHSINADHTGDANGYFMLINASLQKSEFYLDTVKGLCPSTTYEFAAWVMNVILQSSCGGNTIPPNLTFNIETTSGAVLQTYSTGDIGATATPQWRQNGFFFTTPSTASNIVLRIINNSQGGCGNDLAIDDITFRPCGPELSPSFTDGTPGNIKDLCEGDNTDVSMQSDVSQGYVNPVYQWQQSTDNGAVWEDIPGANSEILSRSFTSALPAADYIYRLTVVEGANGNLPSCRVASSTLIVRVNTNPVAAATNNAPVCEGTSLILTASGGSQYVWSGVNSFSSAGSAVVIDDVSSAAAGKYYVEVTSAAGCKDRDSTTVSVNPRPVASTALANVTICSSDSVTLSSAGGISYLWAPSAGLSDINISDPVAKPDDTTLYTVIVTNQLSCTDSAFVTVNVISAPEVDAGADQFILEGQSVQLPAAASGNIAGYLWSPATDINDIRMLQPVVNPINTIRYVLTIASDNGCGVYRDSVMVYVYKKVIVPNAFSPNADGINDLWNITALNTYKEYNLFVFNRYGLVVFKTKNYNNNWNGTYNGKPLPVGTYYYLIDLKNNLPKLSGPVTILR